MGCSMEDGEFLRLFHDGDLPSEEFRHRGHLRLAWLVLSKHSRIEAERIFTRESRRVAISKGVSSRSFFSSRRNDRSGVLTSSEWVQMMQCGPFLTVTSRAPCTSFAVRCPELAYGTIRSASP